MKPFAVVLTALALFGVSAYAAPAPRTVDMTAPLLDLDGKPMVECAEPAVVPADDPRCKARRIVTVGTVVARALLTPEQNVQPEDLRRRGDLGVKLYAEKAAELSADNVVLIKKEISRVFGNPLFAARIFPLLVTK